jgi:hypothetical protein
LHSPLLRTWVSPDYWMLRIFWKFRNQKSKTEERSDITTLHTLFYFPTSHQLHIIYTDSQSSPISPNSIVSLSVANNSNNSNNSISNNHRAQTAAQSINVSNVVANSKARWWNLHYDSFTRTVSRAPLATRISPKNVSTSTAGPTVSSADERRSFN